MLSTRWLSSVRGRLRSRKAPRLRHADKPLASLPSWLLEDRCLMSRAVLPHQHVMSRAVLPHQHVMSRAVPAHRQLKVASESTIYVANRADSSLIGPYTLQNPAASAGSVIFLGGTNPNTGSFDWGNVPSKLVTFKNDSNNQQTIYPFLYSPNDNKIYDPIDTANDEYRLYIGYQQDGKVHPGPAVRQDHHRRCSAGLLEWRTSRHRDRRRQPVPSAGSGPDPQPLSVHLHSEHVHHQSGCCQE